MIFTSPEFVLFLLIFMGIYGSARHRQRKYVLLAASYLFYGSWNAKFLFLIIASTVLDYLIGAALHRSSDEHHRRRLLSYSVLGNLGALAFFKYCNFFIDSAVGALQALGVSVEPTLIAIVLPVGISFYTFQTLTYSIDIYYRRIDPTDSLIDFALYVAFFPQLVAGPIERASHLLPQLRNLDKVALPGAWGLIALGTFKKVVIADHMAALVAITYSDPSITHPAALWIGTYAFAIQIYCDFSGYSDIAVGLARLMGIDIVQNFHSPYASGGPSEFWKRWHVSLSSWLRDYLYIPLGGNRKGGLATSKNLFLTMLLGGLWHGAAWNYVLWGAYQGALLFAARPFQKRPGEPLRNSYLTRGFTVLRRFGFFHLTCLGWALFRAPTLADCATVWKKLLNVTQWNLSAWWSEVGASGEGRYLGFMFAVMVTLVLLQNVLRTDTKTLVDRLWRAPAPLRFIFVVVCFASAALLAPETPPPFIYFQF